MAEGIDYSWARPGGSAIASAGKTFIMRYLYPDGQGGKGLDLSEVQDARANGLLIGTVFESSGNRALSGFAGGQIDAHTAVAQLSDLGMADTVVYLAVDFDPTAAQLVVIGQYLDGAASVLGKDKTGGYGAFSVIDQLCGGVHADYGWQTYAWSHGLVSANANVYQYLNGQTLNGGGVDLCRNLKDDFGAFGGTVGASAGGATGGAALAVNSTQSSWKDIQVLLNTFGYNLAEDNILGPNTTAAVGNFQSTHGLVEDYNVGPLTLAALQAGPGNNAPAPASSAPAVGVLSVDGNFGTLTIKAMQTALGVTSDGIIGYNTIMALQGRCGASQDGVMGPLTREAVQAHVGVTQDGVWGPITVKAIQTALNNAQF